MMESGRRGAARRNVLAAVLLGAAVCAPLGADQSPRADQPTCPEPSARTAAAAELADLADLEIRTGGSWSRAAWLLVHSASMLPRCDAGRFTALRTAARYYHFAGDDERASAVSFEAGEHGVWTGHVGDAADAFIDAATFALEAGDLDRARTAADHALALGESPHLGAPQRLAIRGRAESLLESIGPGGDSGVPLAISGPVRRTAGFHPR